MTDKMETTEFKASLDTFTKFMTAIVFVIIISSGVTVFWGIPKADDGKSSLSIGEGTIVFVIAVLSNKA